MRNFEEMYDVDLLQEAIPGMVEKINEYTCEDSLPRQGEVVYIIDTIAAGWEGLLQPESIVSEFDLDVEPDDEWVWEHIDEAEAKLTEQAQEHINGVLPDYLGIGFGHVEWNGDYGLLLWWLED